MILIFLTLVLVAAATTNSGVGCNLGSPSVGDFPEFASFRDGICVFQGASELYAQNLVEKNRFSLVSKGENKSCKKINSRQVVVTDIFGKHFKNPDNSSQMILGINVKNLLDTGLNYSAKISMKMFNQDEKIKAPSFFRGKLGVINSSSDLQLIFSIEPEQVNEVINTYLEYNRIRIKIKDVALKKVIGCDIYEFTPLLVAFPVPLPQPDNSHMFTNLSHIIDLQGYPSSRCSSKIISSSDGQQIYSISNNNGISRSTDGGATWFNFFVANQQYFRDIVSSSDGRIVVAIGVDQSLKASIFISSDYGVGFHELTLSSVSSITFTSLAMSATGDKIYVTGFSDDSQAPVVAQSFNKGSSLELSSSFKLGPYSYFYKSVANISCSDDCGVIITSDQGIIQLKKQKNKNKISRHK